MRMLIRGRKDRYGRYALWTTSWIQTRKADPDPGGKKVGINKTGP